MYICIDLPVTILSKLLTRNTQKMGLESE